MSESWLYNLIIYMYALSVLFYFGDYLQPNKNAKKMGSSFLAAVWLLMTVYIGTRMFETGMLPIITIFETLLFYAWLLVTLSFVINVFFKIDLFVFFINIIGFAVATLNFFSDRGVSDQLHEQLVSELLIIHITLSIVSYAAFSIAAIFALLYLLQHRLLKEKKWNSLFRRLPSLELLEMFYIRFTIIGVPLLLLGIILGIIWAYESVVGNFWFDPKVVMSIIVLAFYSFFLYQVVRKGWTGTKAAYINLVTFAIVIINYVLSITTYSFHQWF